VSEGKNRDETLLSVDEVAGQLGVQVSTVQRWCREGRLPCLKPGKSWLIRRSALGTFLERGQRPRSLLDQLRGFITTPDHLVALAEDVPLLHRLDATFFQLGEAGGALLVKFVGGEVSPIAALREGFQRNGLDVDRLEAEGRFFWSTAVVPAEERDATLRRILADAARQGRPVWVCFDSTRPVDLATMLRQHDEMAALVDASQLVVKTAAVEAATADWTPATLRQAQASPRGFIRISRNGLVLSRALPLPER
jgi:excisionase family DNA binding protein